jgi:hypothetical protein
MHSAHPTMPTHLLPGCCDKAEHGSLQGSRARAGHERSYSTQSIIRAGTAANLGKEHASRSIISWQRDSSNASLAGPKRAFYSRGNQGPISVQSDITYEKIKPLLPLKKGKYHAHMCRAGSMLDSAICKGEH